MATKLYESKEITTDGLIYGLNPPVEAFFVTIRALEAEKVLPRGTVLALSATDSKMVMLGKRLMCFCGVARSTRL